jgi:hypothetical protein
VIAADQKRELFVLSTRVWDSLKRDDSHILADMVADLQQHDLFHLPYDVVDLRITESASGETLLLIRNLRMRQPENPRSLFAPGPRLNFANGDVAAVSPRSNWADLLQQGKDPYGLCDTVAVFLILALAARNSDKRVVENKRARLGIGKAENRKYARITYIDLPQQSSAPSRGNEAADRASPRMHLRRGHGREQHFGKDNAQVKRIWIAPTWVNIDGDYQPREEYRARIREVT